MLNIKEESKQLNSIIRKAENSLRTAVEGEYKAYFSGNRVQIYKIEGNKKIYVRKSNMTLIRKVVQTDCDRKILKIAKELKQKVITFEESYKPSELNKIYCGLPSGIEPQIKKWVMTDEEYARNWKARMQEKSSLPVKGNYITGNGEHVRSKSEVIIANMLKEKGFVYIYEKPYVIHGVRVLPDFTVLNPETRTSFLLEHFGMLDNPEYLKSAMSKLELFATAEFFVGINLFITYETSYQPLNIEMLDKFLDAVKEGKGYFSQSFSG